jgi:predicted amidohydrolase
MTGSSIDKCDGLTRRKAIGRAGQGLMGLAAMAHMSGRGARTAAGATAPRPAVPAKGQSSDTQPAEKLRVATCQFPVSGQIVDNAKYIRDFLRQAAAARAHLLHTSEASLSGYPGVDLPSFKDFDWDTLRRETTALRKEASDLGLWLVLGSAHFLDERTKPTNCLYLINPQGSIADRYDKCMCTRGDQKHYSAGNRLVTHEVRGVRIGLAICYDICWPQIYMAYRVQGVTLMIHSFHNARGKGQNCLDVLNLRQVPTRCADNRLWAVANNSSQPYSHWGSFIARPDATVAQQLEINQPGMLIHDFPDGLSEGGWFHNEQPLKLRDDEIMTWGTPSQHLRQADAQAEP